MKKNILLLLIVSILIISCQKSNNQKTVIDEKTNEQIELPPLNNRKYGQIVSDSVELYLEPISNTQIIAIPEINTVVILLEKIEITDKTNKLETWYKVYTSNHQCGWVNEKFLYIPDQENKITDIEEKSEEYLIQSGDNDTAGINWHFSKNLSFKLSVYLLESDTSINYYGKWKLENNIIYVTFDLDNNNSEADTQNVKALFKGVNPKLKSINKNQAFVEIDISPDLNWLWIYGINCSVKTLQ
ncbi:MAG: hypothetical protein J6T84_04340 [Spirochaetaceae bacterium]|nr:hypothetical protein [Spirochaetaceae bacterium]